MQLFYSENIKGRIIELSKEESRHLVQVLRRAIGDEIWFTDGLGNKSLFKIIANNPKKAVLEKVESHVINYPRPNLTIGIAPTKNMDRFEWFLEKATEIGITFIFPFVSTNSVRKSIKKDRMDKIVVAAMKQSLQYFKPEIHALKSFKEVLATDFKGQKFICHLEEENPKPLFDLLKKGEDCLLLIGPEGDFTDEEIILAKESGFITVSLGTNRLRTETAGVVAAQTVALKQS